MSTSALPVIEVDPPIAKGNIEFEAKRQAVLNGLGEKIPKNLHLPKELIENPPSNVIDVPRTCGLLSPEELDITENYDGTALVVAIASQNLTAVSVVSAFAKRAAIAHQLSFCLVDWFLDEAIAQAKYLDDYLQKTGKTIGPLHGIPISLKDMIPLKGRTTSLGLFITMQTAPEDCLLVKSLRDLGAVFYCKTHQTQAGMSAESMSSLGRTLNPYNINLTTGGSSSGEGALVALKGSVIGFGTDIGGSVRRPAAYCGLYGFKGGSYFLSLSKMLYMGIPAELFVRGTTGPLTRTFRDLNLVLSAITSQRQYLQDPSTIPIQLSNEPTFTTPLRIGIEMTNGMVNPHPPITRALKWIHTKLSNHPTIITLKPYKSHSPSTAQDLLQKMLFIDRGTGINQALSISNEPIQNRLESHITQASAFLSNLPFTTPMETISTLSTLHHTLDIYRTNFHQHWQSQEIDILITPADSNIACPHDTSTLAILQHMGIWNLVDYPAMTIPTPVRVDMTKDGEYNEEGRKESLSEDDEWVRGLWDDGKKKVNYNGMPVGLQIVARKYCESDLLCAVGILRELLDLS